MQQFFSNAFQSIVGERYFGIIKPEDAFESSLSVLSLIYQYFQEMSPKPVLFPWLIPENDTCNLAISLNPWRKTGPKVNDWGLLTKADIEMIVECEGNVEIKHQLKIDYYEHFCDLLKFF